MTWRTECWKSLPQKKNKQQQQNEDSLRDLWDNIKHINIYIIGIPQVAEREKGPKNIFEEIIGENLPNMGKEIVNKVQKHRESQAG